MKKEPEKKEYNEYVENITPTHSTFKNCIWAFFVGGLICTLGQALMNLYKDGFGFNKDDAGAYVTITLILLSVLLTGFNWYATIVKFGGAGALVPITGFANSVAASAIEYGVEGQVFGIGVKIFTIAGPVILYGIVSSWIVGLIYWIGQLCGWF